MNSSSSAVPTTCQWCGGYHPDRRCPEVKVIEYFNDGVIKRIEFYTPADNHIPLQQPFVWSPYPAWNGVTFA